MKVLIGAHGRAITSYDLNDGATVKDALESAQLSVEGQLLTVNGAPATENDVLTEGAYLFAKPSIKGAFMRIFRFFIKK